MSRTTGGLKASRGTSEQKTTAASDIQDLLVASPRMQGENEITMWNLPIFT
jgi:hypothetical protein